MCFRQWDRLVKYWFQRIIGAVQRENNLFNYYRSYSNLKHYIDATKYRFEFNEFWAIILSSKFIKFKPSVNVSDSNIIYNSLKKKYFLVITSHFSDKLKLYTQFFEITHEIFDLISWFRRQSPLSWNVDKKYKHCKFKKIQ